MQVRGQRPGKLVNLTEQEIRYLCTESRKIFINQPILLELEAPIKIVGMLGLELDAEKQPLFTPLNRGHSRAIL